MLGSAGLVLVGAASRERLLALNGRHLAFGLVATWLVGIGRYWDNPRVGWEQKVGVGSVVYVFALATVLFLTLLPFGVPAVRWRNLLTYVTLTAPPAVIYAIPVERWMTPAAARTTNVEFLGVVAAWRVALWLVYLVRVARVGWLGTMTSFLLPLCAIVGALCALNLERAVFDFMGGLDERQRTSADGAYGLVTGLAVLGFLLALPVLLMHLAAIVQHRPRRPRGPVTDGASPPPPPQ